MNICTCCKIVPDAGVYVLRSLAGRYGRVLEVEIQPCETGETRYMYRVQVIQRRSSGYFFYAHELIPVAEKHCERKKKQEKSTL